MKRLEKFYNYGGVMRFPDLEFVRKGQLGGHKSDMTTEDIKFVNAKVKNLLEIFNYEITDL